MQESLMTSMVPHWQQREAKEFIGWLGRGTLLFCGVLVDVFFRLWVLMLETEAQGPKRRSEADAR